MPIALYPAGALYGRGDESRSVIGSGDSRIRGVDAIWEYNGLILNYRKWYDTYLITNIDGTDDADIRDSRENRPGEHGEIPYDALYGGRTIVLSGKIRAFNYEKLMDMKYALEDAFNDLSEKPLLIHNVDPRKEVFVMARKNQKLVIQEAQNNWNLERDFIISLRASREYFQSRLENYAGFTNAQITAATPLALANKGNWPSFPRFVVTGNFATGFTIYNGTTNKQMKIIWPVNYYSSAIRTYTVDMLAKTITDGTGENYFKWMDDQSDIFSFVKGINNISVQSVTTKTGNATCDVYWTDNFK